MKLTPHYGIIYNGVYHEAGRPFEIDEKDAEEMRKHGTVEGVRQETILATAPATKPRGRAKKTED